MHVTDGCNACHHVGSQYMALSIRYVYVYARSIQMNHVHSAFITHRGRTTCGRVLSLSASGARSAANPAGCVCLRAKLMVRSWLSTDVYREVIPRHSSLSTYATM